MHMKRTMTLLAAAVLTAHAAHAQYVTYNHDSPKQNQITVMETGTGAFTPEIYYTLLHNKYKKTAAAKNKLSFRTLATTRPTRRKPSTRHWSNGPLSRH